MKKKVIILIAALLSVSLTACGSNDSTVNSFVSDSNGISYEQYEVSFSAENKKYEDYVKSQNQWEFVDSKYLTADSYKVPAPTCIRTIDLSSDEGSKIIYTFSTKNGTVFEPVLAYYALLTDTFGYKISAASDKDQARMVVKSGTTEVVSCVIRALDGNDLMSIEFGS